MDHLLLSFALWANKYWKALKPNRVDYLKNAGNRPVFIHIFKEGNNLLGFLSNLNHLLTPEHFIYLAVWFADVASGTWKQPGTLHPPWVDQGLRWKQHWRWTRLRAHCPPAERSTGVTHIHSYGTDFCWLLAVYFCEFGKIAFVTILSGLFPKVQKKNNRLMCFSFSYLCKVNIVGFWTAQIKYKTV